MQITFLGAAGEVTGSQHLIETDSRVEFFWIVVCFRGTMKKHRPRNVKFHCVPRKLDAVILSHAHIDHSGNLPWTGESGLPITRSSAAESDRRHRHHDVA